MNRLLIGIILGLILGACGYLTVTIFTSFEIISNNSATITIKNESGQYVKLISLQHQDGTIEARGLRDKEEMRFVFSNQGENTYKVVATFENETTLTSQEVYFEIGYRGTETIKKDQIVTERN